VPDDIDRPFKTAIANITRKIQINFNAQGRLKELNGSLSNSYQYYLTVT
jgi:hypothetical protein